LEWTARSVHYLRYRPGRGGCQVQVEEVKAEWRSLSRQGVTKHIRHLEAVLSPAPAYAIGESDGDAVGDRLVAFACQHGVIEIEGKGGVASDKLLKPGFRNIRYGDAAPNWIWQP